MMDRSKEFHVRNIKEKGKRERSEFVKGREIRDSCFRGGRGKRQHSQRPNGVTTTDETQREETGATIRGKEKKNMNMKKKKKRTYPSGRRGG